MTVQSKPLSYLIKDPFIWRVTSLACLFWFVLSFYIPITRNLSWPLLTPLLFVMPVIIYPVLEEIVFRGAVMDFFRTKTPGIVFFYLTKANIFASVIFTSLHFIYHPPLWASAVFIPSLLFGLAKERYQSLIPPILLHVFFNAGYYWLFAY